MSCEKEDELVVDRVVSPVLVTVTGNSFLATEPVMVTTTIAELNKSGILDHSVGIDTLPVSNLPIKVLLNNNTLAELTTDAAGTVTLNKTWADLGITAPAVGNSVVLEWSGNYKGQAFTKTGRVQVK
ncbi:hypothetical protein AHMF7605_19995 [Adhaeribacter arboris]|uniref:Uncharacterized protein n=2 Tax=Adhaeribacter arboris TaxID=2072846 RepID=A0A2T2YPF1_9BACT|nr:hypothetical protein AHMF7605_19995 [Adhaeribacter arboris]